MNKKLVIVLIVAAFVVGAIGGGFGISYFWVRFVNKFFVTTEAAQAGIDVSVLNCIRKNDVTNAAELLETELDGSLIGLSAYVESTPKAQRDQMDMKIIQRAKDYRSKFPHENSEPEINQAISNAFLLVETNK
jgi:hypothetical protein